MRRNVWKKGLAGNILALFMVLMFVLGMALNVQASASEADRKGSFTLSLKEIADGDADLLSGVQLKLYKVGSFENDGMSRFVIDSNLQETGVDFGNLTTAEDTLKATEELAKFVPSSSLVPIVSETDADGVAVFENLEQGMYLIMEGDDVEYLDVAPMLMSIPYMESAEVWLYDVNVYPKIVIHEIPTSLKVTKRVYTIDENLDLVLTPVEDRVFTVGLFLDEEGTIPANENFRQDIHLVNAATGSVVYENLPEGKYYLYEIDEDGVLIEINSVYENKEGETWSTNITNADEEEENAVEINIPEFVEKEYFVNNYLYEIPDNYYFEGQISITKKVLINGEKAEVDDTFYAGIFLMTEEGVSELLKVVTLRQNDTVITSVPLNLVQGVPVETTFEVYETDENGNPVGDDFEYTVSGEGSVVLKEASEVVNVTIVNEKEVEAPIPTVTQPPVNDDDDEPKDYDDVVVNPVKTGDESPIIMLVALLVIMLAIVAGLLVIMKKRRNRR